MSPLPWKKVLLAVLPGLAYVASWYGFESLPYAVAIIIPVAVTLAVLVVSFRLERSLPVWALPGLGMLAAVLLLRLSLILFPAGRQPSAWSRAFSTALAITLYGVPPLVILGIILRGWRSLPRARNTLAATLAIGLALGMISTAVVYPVEQPHGIVALLGAVVGLAGMSLYILAGLPLAKRHGQSAALFVVGAAALMTIFLMDPDYGLWHTAWADLLPAAILIAYLVIAPVAVLRASTARGKAIGVLAPVVPAMSAAVLVPALIRDYPPVTWLFNLSIATQFVLTLVFTLALYHDLSRPPEGVTGKPPATRSLPPRRISPWNRAQRA